MLCGIRFYVPPKAAAMDEEKKGEDDNPEPNFATQLHESIKRMSKVEETVGDLICTLQDLPLVVPR